MINNEVRSSLKLVCEALNKQSVEFIIVGGVAVGFHGHYRVSAMAPGLTEIKHDIDFWYKPTTNNFHNLIEALRALELDVSSLEGVIFDKNQFLRLIKENFKMEFLPQMLGLDSFDSCFNRSEKVMLDGNSLPIICYKDLIKNKTEVNREIDQKDIEELKRINKK